MVDFIKNENIKCKMKIKDKFYDIIEKQLRKGRRIFGESGASLTHIVNTTDGSVSQEEIAISRAGIEGEKMTSILLKEWQQGKEDVVVVHSVHIEDSNCTGKEDTDHIIIIGKTMIIIDSKRWAKRKTYTIDEETNEVLQSKKQFVGGDVHINQCKHLWRKYLSHFDITITPLIVIANDSITVIRDKAWWLSPYKIFPAELLSEWLDKIYNNIPEEDKGFIDLDLVASVVKNVVRPFNVAEKLLPNVAHLLKVDSNINKKG